jgi:Fe-S cluster assembly protein SufD
MKKNYLYITHPNDLNFAFLEGEEQNLIIFLNSKSEKNLKYKFNFPNKNSKTEILFLIIQKKSDKIEIQIDINHTRNNSISDLKFKTVLFDEARISFTGNIIVKENLKNITSSLTHKNLLLSEKAKVISKPNLEIKSDNVEINHGFATGKFSHDLLHYMETRGIRPNEIQNKLILAFLFQEINKIKDTELRKQIKKDLKCSIRKK